MDNIYFITDDSSEPLDPIALSVVRMDKNLFIERYGSLDWAFDSESEACSFIQDRFDIY